MTMIAKAVLLIGCEGFYKTCPNSSLHGSCQLEYFLKCEAMLEVSFYEKKLFPMWSLGNIMNS